MVSEQLSRDALCVRSSRQSPVKMDWMDGCSRLVMQKRRVKSGGSKSEMRECAMGQVKKRSRQSWYSRVVETRQDKTRQAKPSQTDGMGWDSMQWREASSFEQSGRVVHETPFSSSTTFFDTLGSRGSKNDSRMTAKNPVNLDCQVWFWF